MKKTAQALLAISLFGGIAIAQAPGWAMEAQGRPVDKNAVDPRCAETARNRVVITDFANVFYREGNIERAMMTYVSPNYIQHSPGVPDGRAAMLDMAKHFAGRPKPHFEIRRIVVDGDIAVLHIKGQLNPALPAESVFDMFRLKDGKIVEHWDVRQAVPATSANANTMF